MDKIKIKNSTINVSINLCGDSAIKREVKNLNNMNKAKFGSVPPKTQMLPDGRHRVYLNPTMKTETNVIKEMDSDKEVVEECDTYLCDELDMSETPTYARVVDALIRTRYTISDELSIMRQKEAKPEEFDAYNAFAESCKAIAREWNER